MALLPRALRALGVQLSSADAQRIMAEADVDRTGALFEHEFAFVAEQYTRGLVEAETVRAVEVSHTVAFAASSTRRLLLQQQPARAARRESDSVTHLHGAHSLGLDQAARVLLRHESELVLEQGTGAVHVGLCHDALRVGAAQLDAQGTQGARQQRHRELP